MAAALRAGFWKVQGPALAIAGLAVAFITWNFANTQTVPLWLVCVIATPILITFWVLLAALDRALRLANKRLPAVRLCAAGGSLYKGAEAVLILEPSDIYALGSVVSVYRQNDLHEELIALGRVESIQENRYIQVTLRQMTVAGRDVLAAILANEAATLRSLLVKPNVPELALPLESEI